MILRKLFLGLRDHSEYYWTMLLVSLPKRVKITCLITYVTAGNLGDRKDQSTDGGLSSRGWREVKHVSGKSEMLIFVTEPKSNTGDGRFGY